MNHKWEYTIEHDLRAQETFEACASWIKENNYVEKVDLSPYVPGKPVLARFRAGDQLVLIGVHFQDFKTGVTIGCSKKFDIIKPFIAPVIKEKISTMLRNYGSFRVIIIEK